MESDQDLILQLSTYLEQGRVVENLQVARFTVLVFYYLSTFDEEVNRIWSQPNLRLGKILFLISRYSNYGRICFEIIVWTRTYTTLSMNACFHLHKLYQASAIMAVNAPDAIFWLCIYALLGGPAKFFPLVVFLYLAFLITIQALQILYVQGPPAIEVDPVSAALGYACSFQEANNVIYDVVSTYLYLARTVLVMTFALATIFVRYRKQKNRLIGVIRREGGIYYVCGTVFAFFSAIVRTPNSNIVDTYLVVENLRLIFIPICADRLLLKMQEVNDPGTRANVSTLIFNPGNVPGKGDGETEEMFKTEDGIHMQEMSVDGDKRPNHRET